jgi:hypothetical protein
MLSHVGFSPAAFAATLAAATLAATAFPMSSDTDYVSPYLRRPLRPLDEVERTRKARESRRPAPQRDQDEGKAERLDQ